MSYEILDINTVARYAKGVKAISDVLGDGEYIAKEVGDGNLNLVFIVENPAKQTSVGI